jgi:antitoxin MazE
MISSLLVDIMEAIMQVSRWGNSLAVRLPKKLVEEMKLVPGDEVNLVGTAKDTITVEKIDRKARFLKDMEQFNFPLPEGYRFDRDEANER